MMIGPIIRPIIGPIVGPIIGFTVNVQNCLINNGVLIGATFNRTGNVLATVNGEEVVFGVNTPVRIGTNLLHHGQITATSPTYDISPLVRPTGSDVYDTAASAPAPSTHGGIWNLFEEQHRAMLEALDGAVTGLDHITNGSFESEDAWSIAANWSVANGRLTGAAAVAANTQDLVGGNLSSGTRYQMAYIILEHTNGQATVTMSDESPDWQDAVGMYQRRFTSSAGQLRIDGRDSQPFTGSISLVGLQALANAVSVIAVKDLNITPTVAQWVTTTDLNILSGDSGNQMLYVEIATGRVCLTDGTNTAFGPAYTAGTDHLIHIILNGTTMAVAVDGVVSPTVAFVGTLNPGRRVRWGLGAEDNFSVEDVCVREPSAAALFLAHDVPANL